MLSWSINDKAPIRLGYAVMNSCDNSAPTSMALTELMQTTILAVQQRFENKVLSDDPIVQQIRLLFRAVGIDPTRYRPSGEALIRRALKNEPVRSINPLVDINNICSMQSGLPMGCYDLDKVQGDNLHIRLGQSEENYEGVAKIISIGGKLCVADAAGAFGSPISDSARTQVTTQTQQCLVVIFGHTQTDSVLIQKTLDHFINLTEKYLGAKVADQKILP